MEHIVHVDNSEFFRKQMKVFLTELGYEYTGFSRGEDALKAASAGNADCVITGLTLADMEGEALIRRLNVSADTVSVIVVTASHEDAQIRRLNSLNVLKVISKSGDWKTELSSLLA